MKPDPSSTFNPALVSDESARRFRNQGTGIGSTRSASCPSSVTPASVRTGARRSQAVIDAAPAAQQRVADRSYPAPLPDGVVTFG